MKRILSLLLVLVLVGCLSVTAFAAPVDEATIDFDRTGNIDLWKYDLTNAEKDGVWSSSYVSTGVRDENGVESVLGDPQRISPLNEHGNAYGYALAGVEFTYLRIGELRTYTETEDGVEHIELLYGIPNNAQNTAMLTAIGVSTSDRYTNADKEDGSVYYYRSDVLIDGLEAALEENSTTVKDVLENYVAANGGTKMPETDAYGHSSAKDLPLGLYLFVESKVPEMVTDTTAPFLVSVPMTAVNGNNASDGGERWLYDIALYPKNITGIPTLEKTLRESWNDTGKHDGDDITDGYAHTGTASDGDVIQYQIISSLPSITSAASYLTDYSFTDSLSAGLAYNKNDVKIEFFRGPDCKDKIATWTEADNKFTVSYSSGDAGESVMSIGMTEQGLSEINTSDAVYTGVDAVNSGYSNCTLRITYAATMHSDKSVVYGDKGNPNDVVLTWKRTNSSYYDTLIDDAHVYTYGINLLKKFNDGKGDLEKVEFILRNDTDAYFVTAKLAEDEGVYYVTGHVSEEKEATHFIPNKDGKILIRGLEDDEYTLTEVKTDNAYSLLKNSIKVKISTAEDETPCSIYEGDVLGLLQNDERYANVDPGRFPNMPQVHLEHKTLTASSTINGKDVSMAEDGDSDNAFSPMTVINTRGFNLPQTGGYGNWAFPVIGISGFALAMLGIYVLLRKKKTV